MVASESEESMKYSVLKWAHTHVIYHSSLACIRCKLKFRASLPLILTIRDFIPQTPHKSHTTHSLLAQNHFVSPQLVELLFRMTQSQPHLNFVMTSHTHRHSSKVVTLTFVFTFLRSIDDPLSTHPASFPNRCSVTPIPFPCKRHSFVGFTTSSPRAPRSSAFVDPPARP